MKKGTEEIKSIDEYIRSSPEHTRAKLVELRDLIREQAPQADEKISYQIPTFFLNGNLVHFAAYAKHIGFYPGSRCIGAFRDKLPGFKSAKGSVQFPLDDPLPIGLIRKMIRFRVEENMKRKQPLPGRRPKR